MTWEYTTENGLPRTVVECDSLLAAEEIREQWPDALVPADDRRKKTVVVSGDIRDEWLFEIEQLAIHETPESFGQAPLSQREKLRLDFTETNVFHARSCKAIAQGMGVVDWLSWYDPTCTVDEHREIYRRPAAEPETLRKMPTPQEFRPPRQAVTTDV
jgi:hypothetical protein